MYVVLDAVGDAPQEIKDLLAARQVATVTGDCPVCGAIAGKPGFDHREVGHVIFRHEDDCPVSDGFLIPALRKFLAGGGEIANAIVIVE